MTTLSPPPPVDSDPRPTAELTEVLRVLQEEHGVPAQAVVAAIEAAVPAAWSQVEPRRPPVEARLDPATGELTVELLRLVVEGEAVGEEQISLIGARELDPQAGVGTSVLERVALPKAVAARAARLVRQAVGSRLRQARRERLSEEAAASRGLLVASIVERVEAQTVFLRAHRLQAYLPAAEQIPGEVLARGDHVRVVLLEARAGGGEELLQVRASRANALLLRRLLEAEVPEVAEGLVQIRAVAREPGDRSKVAVESLRTAIDAKGACIGPKGVRIRAVVSQLNGERVDVIEWADDPAELVARALAPARVGRVALEGAAHRATLWVNPQSLSLAIGKEGQNARLAARLTGWRIDIRPEEESR